MKNQTPNPHHLPAAGLSVTRRWLGLALSGALLATASAQSITNYFTDGDGTDPTPLDQYPSAAGAGWLAGWVSQLGSGAFLTAGVSNATPLNGGGNYLGWQLGGGTAASTIRRQFSTVNDLGFDVLQPYVIEFDYRLDQLVAAGVANSTNSFTSTSDFLSISQNGATGADVTGRATFWVKSQGATSTASPGLAARTWSFFEGALAGTTESRGLFISSTNVALATNTVYHFKFEVDPIARVYEGTVSDGVNTFNTTTATGRKLRWRNYTMATDAANLSNTTIMTFTARNNAATETNYQSLDNLTIYQLNSNLWPVVLTQVTPVKAQTFYPATSNIVLTAQTFGTNTLPASGTQFILNGVDVTAGLTFDGTDSSSNRTITYNGALQVNKLYEATLNVADQAGRLTTLPFFFDTFTTNGSVTILETENYNFDPALPYCSPLQTDGTRPDRYIQNWLDGGPSPLDPSGATNVVDSYFGRDATFNIDYFTPTPVVPSNFRTCGDIGMRNSPGDEYERPWIEAMGISEVVNDRNVSGVWMNYTHEWTNGNYLVYLRASAALTNIAFDLHKVTSDYTVSGQTSNKLGTFIMTNAPLRREILKNYLPTAPSGKTLLLALSGKETLRLTVVGGDTGDNTYLNRMVFVPVPDLTISNVSLSGTDLSFSINTINNVGYTVQYKDNVTNPNWSTLTTVVGTGGDVVVHDNPIGGDQRYYRVVSP